MVARRRKHEVEPHGLDEQDLFGQLVEKRGSRLWLGRFHAREIERALARRGLLRGLEARGLGDWRVAVEPMEPGLEALRLYSGPPEPHNLVAELRAREARAVPPFLPPGAGSRVLRIEWLLVQNPRAALSAERPPLPGQHHPGLGRTRQVVAELERVARLLEVEAVVAVPQSFHSAAIFHRWFHFIDPSLEGRLEALLRDLANYGLAECAWALIWGCVLEMPERTPAAWRPGEQALPVSERWRAYFAGGFYRRAVAQARDAARFVVDRERFLARWAARDWKPVTMGPGSPAEERTAREERRPMNHRSIPELFREIVGANAGRVAYRYKSAGTWHPVSWTEHDRAVRTIAKALMASGIRHGDRVAILSQTRLEWIQCDFGVGHAGAVTVGIYPSNLAPECAYILEHSDAVAIFVENDEQLRKILAVRDRLPKLRTIVRYEGESDRSQGVVGWQEFLERAADVGDDELEERIRGIGPEDLLSLVYTSGTTGVPKGAMITHANMLFTCESAMRSLYIEPHFETLLFLPLAHVFARLIVYGAMRCANTLIVAESIQKVAENLRETRPHYIASAPRIYEKVYEKITTAVEDAGGLKKKIFDWAVRTGRRVSEAKQAGWPVPRGLAFKYALAHRLVFHKIHEALGGRLVYAISGAAPLNADIARFFHACGLLILEGYGMTEDTSFSHVNRYQRYRFGTVGLAGPGIECRTAEDGEILIRGPNVMRGYFKDAEATRQTIDGQGWLHTGDIGEIDAEGFLRITDRKKDLIVTAGGKNVAPQRVEKALRTSRYISQAIAIGDRRKFISALVTLDPDHIAAWAREKGIASESLEALSRHPEVERLIAAEIEACNRQLASFESVKKFRILPADFAIETGEMTPTLKVRRKVVMEKYARLIDEMYAEAAAGSAREA